MPKNDARFGKVQHACHVGPVFSASRRRPLISTKQFLLDSMYFKRHLGICLEFLGPLSARLEIGILHSCPRTLKLVRMYSFIDIIKIQVDRLQIKSPRRGLHRFEAILSDLEFFSVSEASGVEGLW